MRSTLLILILSGGALAFGQAGPSFRFSSGQPIQTSAPGRDFGTMPRWPRWDPALTSLRTETVLLPGPKSTIPLGDASIDPRMVHHPSRKDIGTLPPGTQVAQNLFPGLVFQPIEAPRCAPLAGPLATTWPRLQVEHIPTEWPRLKMGPLAGPGQASPVARFGASEGSPELKK